MKKKLIILLLIIALIPIRSFASGVSDYKETDDQAVIYMFRGQGCGYCRAFLTYLGSITEEYGKYFKLVSFEVWNDQTNSELFEKIATFNKEDLEKLGVPYIVIGEKVFRGYSEEWNQDIIDAIMAQYENPSYDVMKKAGVDTSKYTKMNLLETFDSEELTFEETTKKSSGTSSSFAIIFWNAFFIVIATAVIVYMSNKNTQKVLDAMKAKK